MEETKELEPKVRWNIKQSAKLEMYFDITVRAENNEDAETLIKDGIARLKEICGQK